MSSLLIKKLDIFFEKRDCVESDTQTIASDSEKLGHEKLGDTICPNPMATVNGKTIKQKA